MNHAFQQVSFVMAEMLTCLELAKRFNLFASCFRYSCLVGADFAARGGIAIATMANKKILRPGDLPLGFHRDGVVGRDTVLTGRRTAWRQGSSSPGSTSDRT